MQICFKEIKEWRDWLEKNYDTEQLIWLIYYKKHTKTPTLENHPEAFRNFQHLAPSHKKAYAGWVMQAKKDETRRRRLSEMINKLEKGQTLGLK